MSIGRTNSGSGGGILKAFAIIKASFPVGSVCTCTDGNKTLKAKDTSGFAFFPVPYAATWTVSCTDGTQTASKSVVISTQYQVEELNLLYALYLYDHGDQCIENSGGWAYRKTNNNYGGSITFENDRFITSITYANVTGNNVGYGYAKNLIDLSEYSTIVVDGYSNGNCNLILSSTNIASGDSRIATKNVPQTRQVFTLDVSAINSAYIAFRAESGSTTTRYCYVYSVYAE